jgi:hypothetical protein
MYAQYNLKEDFFWVWAKKNFPWSFLDHLLVSIAIFYNFHCYMYFKNYQKYWIPYAHALTFMRRLSRRVRNWCNPDHMHQFFTHMLSMRISFSIFQMFILRTLSMRLRNWCMQWPCASGTDAYAEHIRQELMRALSLRVRNWCVHWACMSGTDACIKGRTGTDAHTQHVRY